MTATTQPGITLEEQIAFCEYESRTADAQLWGGNRAAFDAILDSLIRLREIESKLRETYEIYAGMEGIPLPKLASEAYLLRVIDQMQQSISILLRGKP